MLRIGDRVELASLGCLGTVRHADLSYVKVQWDDGQTGLLYYDGSVPNARKLLKLAQKDH